MASVTLLQRLRRRQSRRGVRVGAHAAIAATAPAGPALARTTATTAAAAQFGGLGFSAGSGRRTGGTTGALAQSAPAPWTCEGKWIKQQDGKYICVVGTIAPL